MQGPTRARIADTAPGKGGELRSISATGSGAPFHHTRNRTAWGRIVGVDIARGMAILGMMAVHILDPGPFPWTNWIPGNWDRVFLGRSSILFAIIAGISIAFISGGTRPIAGTPLRRARARILVRAVIIFAVGAALQSLDHNIAVILEYYAVLFVLVLPFLTWQPKRLFQLVAALVVVLPPLYFIVINLAMRSDFGNDGTLTRLLFTGTYPAIIWVIFILIGLGVGRLDLTATRVHAWLLLTGTAMMTIGYGSGQIAEWLFPESSSVDGELPGRFDLSRMATMEPHSGTWFEVVSSSGVALEVIAVCLFVSYKPRVVLYPLAAAGSMALTVYVSHVVSMVWIWPSITIANQYQIYLWTVLIALLLTTLWSLVLGKGPLERFLTLISQRTADNASS